MKLGTLLLFYAIWLCRISSVKIPLQETLDEVEQKQLNDLIKETKNKDKNSEYTMSLDDVDTIENKTDNKMYMTDIDNKDKEVIKSLKKEDKDNKEYMIDLDDEDKEIIKSLIGKDNMKYMMDLDDKEKKVIKSLTKEIIKEKTKTNQISNKHIDTVQPKPNPIVNETPIKREQHQTNQIHKVNDKPITDKNKTPSPNSSVIAQNSMTVQNEQTEPNTNSAITTTTSSPTGGTVTTTNINIKIGNLREDSSKKECSNKKQTSRNQELLSKISSKLDLLIQSNRKESNSSKEDPKIIDKLLSIIKQKIK